MTENASQTNPMDDYENGVITFEELYTIIEAMPKKEFTAEEQAYYRELAEKAERGEFTLASGAKIYRGEEASKQGRDLIRRALEPSKSGVAFWWG